MLLKTAHPQVKVPRLRSPIFHHLKYFLFYEVVLVIRRIIPDKCRKILEMLFKLIELCEITGSRSTAKGIAMGSVAHTLTWIMRPMFCTVLNI